MLAPFGLLGIKIGVAAASVADLGLLAPFVVATLIANIAYIGQPMIAPPWVGAVKPNRL